MKIVLFNAFSDTLNVQPSVFQTTHLFRNIVLDLLYEYIHFFYFHETTT